MLTLEKVKEFDRFGGNGDAWERGWARPSTVLSNEEFVLIERFLEDLLIIHRGLASSEYQARAEERLRVSCEGVEVIDALRDMAIRLAPRR
jgi:hypothetical protein